MKQMCLKKKCQRKVYTSLANTKTTLAHHMIIYFYANEKAVKGCRNDVHLKLHKRMVICPHVLRYGKRITNAVK